MGCQQLYLAVDGNWSLAALRPRCLICDIVWAGRRDELQMTRSRNTRCWLCPASGALGQLCLAEYGRLVSCVVDGNVPLLRGLVSIAEVRRKEGVRVDGCCISYAFWLSASAAGWLDRLFRQRS